MIMIITIAHLYKVLDVSDPVLSPLYLLAHLALTTTLEGRYHCYSCFIHKNTKTQSSPVTWVRVTQQGNGSAGIGTYVVWSQNSWSWS